MSIDEKKAAIRFGLEHVMLNKKPIRSKYIPKVIKTSIDVRKLKIEASKLE